MHGPVQHPDSRLTLREAFEKYYPEDQISAGTRQQYYIALRKWEKFTGNPPIGDIGNQHAELFRSGMLEKGLGGETIKSQWTAIRAIFRCVCQPLFGNPHGVGIVNQAPPYMRPVPSTRAIPRRLTLDDLERVYLAAAKMTTPGGESSPTDWWRCLLVLAYFSGMRISDLLAVENADIDLKAQTVKFTARKTQKPIDMPLHAIACEHIARIQVDRKLLFGNGILNRKFYGWMKELCHRADVEPFGMHDIRRTAASEIERVRFGMAAVLLQHRQTDVTGASYLNMLDELRDAIAEMRVPLSFKHGIVFQEKAAKKRQAERLQPRDFATPYQPAPEDWQFSHGAFTFRGGRSISMVGANIRVLRALALADGAVDCETLARAIYVGLDRPDDETLVRGRVAGVVSVLRDRLRRLLFLDDGWDPVPCVERGAGGRWELRFPGESRDLFKGE